MKSKFDIITTAIVTISIVVIMIFLSYGIIEYLNRNDSIVESYNHETVSNHYVNYVETDKDRIIRVKSIQGDKLDRNIREFVNEEYNIYETYIPTKYFNGLINPDWEIDEDGFYKDKDGYYVICAPNVFNGDIIYTSLGQSKIYQMEPYEAIRYENTSYTIINFVTNWE